MSADQGYPIYYGDGTNEVAPICLENRRSIGFGYFSLINNFMSVVIVLESMIARSAFIALSNYIRWQSLTNKMKNTVVSVFLIFFLNYGLLYLFSPMEKSFIPWFSYFTVANYPDFN